MAKIGLSYATGESGSSIFTLETAQLIRFIQMPRVTITVPEKNAQPYRFQLDRQTVGLGRGSENDIVIDSGSVSVRHAEMQRVVGGYELRDLGSTNGIKLDDARSEVIPLRNGITLKIGDASFDFALNDEEIDALAREQPVEITPLPGEAEPRLPVRRSQQIPARALSKSGGSGFGATLLLLILAAAAFFTGLAVRYQKETGGSLIEAIKVKSTQKSPLTRPAGSATPTLPQ